MIFNNHWKLSLLYIAMISVTLSFIILGCTLFIWGPTTSTEIRAGMVAWWAGGTLIGAFVVLVARN